MLDTKLETEFEAFCLARHQNPSKVLQHLAEYWMDGENTLPDTQVDTKSMIIAITILMRDPEIPMTVEEMELIAHVRANIHDIWAKYAIM